MKQTNRDCYFVGHVSNFVSTRGYIIGHFMDNSEHPALKSENVEVAWKHLPISSQVSTPHFHRQGLEVTVVISGCLKLLVNGTGFELRTGNFLVVYPETIVQTLEITEDTDLIVVKTPSIAGDKFEITE